MEGRTVSGEVPQAVTEAAMQVMDDEGTTMSALVSEALTLYLCLPAAARRSARYVLEGGSPEARDLLVEGCGRAVARAADSKLTAQLAATGQAMGIQDFGLTDEAIEAAAVAAVREARAARQT